jgi:hypothetical protein
MENTVICRVDYADRVLLVGHNPPVVFATTVGHVADLPRQSNGHYSREDLLALVESGGAVLYNEETLRDVLEALPIIVHGCPPVDAPRA